MTIDLRGSLLRQFDVAWGLASYHLDGLTTAECLWRPATAGLHVRQDAAGRWRADWPDHERYDLGPPSIAWTTWHIGFWWSMAIDHTFGAGTLTREAVEWPGSAELVVERIGALERQWRDIIQNATDSDLVSTARTRWPFENRPLGDLIGWASIELTKNAAELGYGRFLYAVRSPR